MASASTPSASATPRGTEVPAAAPEATAGLGAGVGIGVGATLAAVGCVAFAAVWSGALRVAVGSVRGYARLGAPAGIAPLGGGAAAAGGAADAVRRLNALGGARSYGSQ